MDQAHEVQLRARGRGHLQVDRLTLLPLAGDAGVTRLVDRRRRLLADPVLEVLELRRRVAVRVGAVRLAELLADLTLEQRLERPRQILLRDDGEDRKSTRLNSSH